MKAVCLGLAFGLVAGGVFWGIGGLMGVTNGKGEAANSGMNVNIVKTSSTDVKTISATDVSDIVEQCMPSIVAVNTQVVTTSNFFSQTYSQEGSGMAQRNYHERSRRNALYYDKLSCYPGFHQYKCDF